MAIEIAQLVPGDWKAFRALRIAALSESPGAFAATLDGELALSEADWRARLATRALFVARDRDSDDGTALGMVGARRDGDAIELISMWVAPSARGRGLGEALVRRVLGHARAAGCSEVGLWFAEGNTVAERLYARCGFVLTGVIQPAPIGGNEVGMRADAAALAAASIADADADQS